MKIVDRIRHLFKIGPGFREIKQLKGFLERSSKEHVPPPPMICPKCGNDDWNVKWHPESKTGNGKCSVIGEHLHYYCKCGYDWNGPTIDQRSMDFCKKVIDGMNEIGGKIDKIGRAHV